MRTVTLRRSGLAACVVGVALAMTGCASGGTSATSAPDATSPVDPASTSPTDPVTPNPGVVTGQAHGGGDFCKLVAAASNNPAIGGTSAASIQKHIDAVRVMEQQALDLSPSSLKGDVTVLFTASNSMYDALAKVNYDYSKLQSSDMSVLSSPAVTAAEHHVTAYITHVCKIS